MPDASLEHPEDRREVWHGARQVSVKGTEPPTLEVQINHFSALQAAFVDEAINGLSDIDLEMPAGCFIDTINRGITTEPYLLSLFFLSVAALIGVVRYGGKFK